MVHGEQGLLYFGSQTEPACKLEDIVSMDKEDLDIEKSLRRNKKFYTALVSEQAKYDEPLTQLIDIPHYIDSHATWLRGSHQ